MEKPIRYGKMPKFNQEKQCVVEKSPIKKEGFFYVEREVREVAQDPPGPEQVSVCLIDDNGLFLGYAQVERLTRYTVQESFPTNLALPRWTGERWVEGKEKEPTEIEMLKRRIRELETALDGGLLEALERRVSALEKPILQPKKTR